MTAPVISQAQDRVEEARAIFAGGCFWCVEAAFDYVDGVKETISGYTGGETADPSYEAVGSGDTGHYEALEVVYDPAEVSYETLLDTYWKNIDPTDPGGQFADRGSQYRTAIFYMNEEQKALAEASKARMEEKLGQQIVTEILPAATFYPAEDYHQDYHKQNPARYNMYKHGSGRPARLKDVWGEEDKE